MYTHKPKANKTQEVKSLKNIKGWDDQRYLKQKKVPLHWCLEEDKKLLSQKEVLRSKEALILFQSWASVQNKEQDQPVSKTDKATNSKEKEAPHNFGNGVIQEYKLNSPKFLYGSVIFNCATRKLLSGCGTLH